jgi:deazaflavin-dependent oxidoreductase (nitroreductase family)
MPIEGTYEPNKWQFAADQVERYEASGGTEGVELRGMPCIILWTKGRKSGLLRKIPLMRVKRGDQYAVVGSLGGSPQHPVWVHNLRADPKVSLQDGPELGDYVAREVTGAEKADWWAVAVEAFPNYDEYQAKTDREIPLFVLDPA